MAEAVVGAGGPEEGGVGIFLLVVKEVAFRTKEDGIEIGSYRGGAFEKLADLTWREWRIVKTFIDNAYREIREAMRAAGP